MCYNTVGLAPGCISARIDPLDLFILTEYVDLFFLYRDNFSSVGFASKIIPFYKKKYNQRLSENNKNAKMKQFL